MFPLSSFLTRIIKNGRLTVIDPSGVRHQFGGMGPGPDVTMQLADPKLYRRLFLNPELAAGEAYMDGTMTFPGSSLPEFMKLIGGNQRTTAPDAYHVALEQGFRALKRLHQRNPVGKAQRNVAHHYDLGNALYEQFLDAGMFYSCAYFESDTDTLEDAQRSKCRLIAAKLGLTPGQKVLDIGCGWGGLAIYLAKMADVEVLGVTLSKEQHALATERARAAGVAGKVRFELVDYRQVQGRFDRIVSVGMFEHVGVPHYDEYFRHVNRLMPDDGVMLLHSIGHMSPPGVASPFLRKYIFPGGYAPALSEVYPAVERNKLWVLDCEFLRLHYALTIRHWYERFMKNRAEVAKLYDERFCRMWEFYLVGVEQMFRTGAQEVFHMQLSRKRDAMPIRRDYIVDVQRALKKREAELLGPPVPRALEKVG